VSCLPLKVTIDRVRIDRRGVEDWQDCTLAQREVTSLHVHVLPCVIMKAVEKL
jgi:hypothetical protein